MDQEIRRLERKARETGSAEDFNVWLHARRRTGDNVALIGIWCPWAQVLCMQCHGPKKYDKPIKNYDDLVESLCEIEEDCAVCTCTDCGREVFVQDEIAYCKRLVDAANACVDLTGEMWQTGGMCVAAAIRGFGDLSNGTVAVGTQICCDPDEDDEDDLYVGIYKDVEDWAEEEPLDSIQNVKPTEVAKLRPYLLKG